MMALLLERFALVDPGREFDARGAWRRDPFDHPVWAAARTGDADFVVSGNTRDYPPRDADGRHRWDGIEHLTPDAFLARLADAA